MKTSLIFAVILLFASWAPAVELSLPPGCREVLYKVQEHLKKGEAERGLELLREFKEKHPESSHHLLFLLEGTLYWSLGRRKEAVNCWQEAVRLNPRDEASWQNLAQALYKLRRYKEAAEAFLQAYRLSERKEFRFYAAVAYLKAQRPRETIALLEASPQGEGLAEQWLCVLLQAYLDIGDLAGAERVLWKLLDRNPERVDYWRWLAQVYLQQRRYIKATASLEIASRFGGGQGDKRELVQLYHKLNIPLKVAWYYEGIYGSDLDPTVCDRIATFYLAAHKVKRALEYIDLALQREPTAKRYLRKGEILYRERRYEEAYDAFRKAASLGKDGYPYLMMGYCAWHLGDLREAEEAFGRAATYAKYRKRAREALKVITGQLGTILVRGDTSPLR